LLLAELKFAILSLAFEFWVVSPRAKLNIWRFANRSPESIVRPVIFHPEIYTFKGIGTLKSVVLRFFGHHFAAERAKHR
jgi:hypothetical protein